MNHRENPSIDSVEITFNFFDLPTPQHKAGLTGLLLQIQSMHDRRKSKETIPEVICAIGTTVTIRFTEVSTQGLMDDFRDAEVAKAEVKFKGPGELPLDDEDIGETMKVKRFAKPAARGPNIVRSEDKPCPEGVATWKNLVAFEAARRDGQYKKDTISSVLLLGPQAVNAKSVSFEGRAEQILLLDVWYWNLFH